MQLTKNFHIDEFKCKDGTPVPGQYLCNVSKLAQNLQVLRDYLGKPIHLNSAYRTPKHNRAENGGSQSKHLTAEAGDLRVTGMTGKQIADAILTLISLGKMHNGGVGIYKNFVHYDVRNLPARWKG